MHDFTRQRERQMVPVQPLRARVVSPDPVEKVKPCCETVQAGDTLPPTPELLHTAIWHGDTDTVKRLLTGNPYLLDYRIAIPPLGQGLQPTFNTALHLTVASAIRTRQLAVLEYILQAGVDPNEVNSGYTPPIRPAVQAMAYEVTHLLLRYDAYASDQPSLLHLGFALNREVDPRPVLEMLTLLVAYGAQPTQERVSCTCGTDSPHNLFQPNLRQMSYGKRHQHAQFILHNARNNLRAVADLGIAVPPTTQRLRGGYGGEYGQP